MKHSFAVVVYAAVVVVHVYGPNPLGEKLARGPIYSFTTKNIEGVEVQLIKVHSDKFLQSSTKIATLDGEDITVKRICPNESCQHEFKPGEWMKEIYIDPEGNDVTIRRPEFQWIKEDAEGKRTPASMARSETINATIEKPFMLLDKNLVRKKDGEFYLMVPWLGEKKKPSSRVEAVALRTKKLIEEAQRMAREGVAGIGSFTTGLLT